MKRNVLLAVGFVTFAVLLLASFGFILSFDVLSSEAVDAGIKPSIADLFPSVVDGTIVLFTVYVVYARIIKSKKMTRIGYSAIIFTTALSIWLNLNHAESWEDSIFFIAPVIVLAWSIHAIAELASEYAERQMNASDLDYESLVLELNRACERLGIEIDRTELPECRIEELEDYAYRKDEGISNLQIEMNEIEIKLEKANREIQLLNATISQLEQDKNKLNGASKYLNLQKSMIQPVYSAAIDYLIGNDKRTQAEIAAELGVSVGTFNNAAKRIKIDSGVNTAK